MAEEKQRSATTYVEDEIAGQAELKVIRGLYAEAGNRLGGEASLVNMMKSGTKISGTFIREWTEKGE